MVNATALGFVGRALLRTVLIALASIAGFRRLSRRSA